MDASDDVLLSFQIAVRDAVFDGYRMHADTHADDLYCGEVFVKLINAIRQNDTTTSAWEQLLVALKLGNDDAVDVAAEVEAMLRAR